MSGWTAAITAAIGAVSAISQAQQQKSAAKYNEKVANQQAVATQQAAAANADKTRRAAQKQIGSMEATYAASGVSLEGSPLEVLEQSSRNAKLDELNILWSGQTSARGYQDTANLEKSKAANAMSSGYMSAAGSLFGASSSFAKTPTGGVDAYSKNVNDSFSRMTMQRIE